MSGLRFHEEMVGFVSFGRHDGYVAAWDAGRRDDVRLSFELDIEIDDVAQFASSPGHPARARGVVRCARLAAGDLPVEEGTWHLAVDVGERHRRMVYRLFTRTPDGHPLTLSGFKELTDDPNYDLWTDTSTLFVRLLAGHLDADAERADATPPVASGILRISHLGFARMVASMRPVGGSPWAKARALTTFDRVFLRSLAGVYRGRPLEGSQPEFPAAVPGSERFLGYEPGAWHDVPERPGVRRRIVGVTAGDGFELNVHQFRSAAREPSRGPVVLMAGAGCRASLWATPPVAVTPVEALLEAGFDVWAANWRGSHDFPPHDWTLDEVAAFDAPAIVRAVGEKSGADGVRAFVHCQGSAGFMIALSAGLLPEVTHVVSSAVSLHPVVPWRARVKQRLVIPLASRVTPYTSPQWGLRPPSALARGLATWARVVRRECDDPVCALANYMYGVGPDLLWQHEVLEDDVHHWAAREFGYCPFRFLRQLSRSVRAGHMVPVDGIPTLPQSYVGEPQTDARVLFVAGTRNRLFLPESQRRTFAHFDRWQPGRHRIELLEGYTHLDAFLGKGAAERVFPKVVAGLG